MQDAILACDVLCQVHAPHVIEFLLHDLDEGFAPGQALTLLGLCTSSALGAFDSGVSS